MKGQVFFEMSSNEYNVMKSHPETYYIFFVNNVNNATTIQRLLAKDIYGEEPIKYRVSFRSKEKTPIQDFSFTEN